MHLPLAIVGFYLFLGVLRALRIVKAMYDIYTSVSFFSLFSDLNVFIPKIDKVSLSQSRKRIGTTIPVDVTTLLKSLYL